jgi:AcrR family transcriptional regulator
MSEVLPLSAGKREQTKQQNRQAILEAAHEAFSELGYETATVRDIIRRTGLSVGAFYNYFRSKEEVREALAADGARRFAPIIKGLRSLAPDFAGFARAAIRAYFDFLAEEHAAWTARRPAGEAHHHVRSESPETEAVFAEVRGAIEEAIAARKAPVADADYLAAACIAMAREVGDKMLERRPVDTEGATDFVVAMILGGVRALPDDADAP